MIEKKMFFSFRFSQKMIIYVSILIILIELEDSQSEIVTHEETFHFCHTHEDENCEHAHAQIKM